MKVQYLVQIENPHQNLVKVTLRFKRRMDQSKMRIFLPSWSPGSYLMREYARHIRWIKVEQDNGEALYFEQVAKGEWEIDWNQSLLKTESEGVSVSYEIYCKELTVRTSHVDSTHAFLHGPSYLMGIKGEALKDPSIEFRFPPLWSKLTTGLKEISTKREEFIYTAKNYDELVDAPVEIGCQETDGFEFKGKNHFLAYYGPTYPHQQNLKADTKKIVETVSSHFSGDLPYENYTFLTHFAPKLYGGLEHLNSTALHFDGRKLNNRKDYLNYLSLVAHEYFHTWNVKRIRPVELGPFDYLNEAYTSLLWLAEGLTSFMDDLLVYRSGLSTLEEYLDTVKGNFDIYYNTPGKKFHSLEMSSFNAWVKLYRPDENSKNSSISYYLKGGLVFSVLHAALLENGKSINDLLEALWKHYLARPEKGINKSEIYDLIRDLAGEKALSQFITMVETTEDIDFESAYKKMGVEFKWIESASPWIGADFDAVGDRSVVKSVTLDSPAYQAGLNAGDEIIALNGVRALKEDTDKLGIFIQVNKPCEFMIARLGVIHKIEVTPTTGPRILKELAIADRALAEKSFRTI